MATKRNKRRTLIDANRAANEHAQQAVTKTSLHLGSLPDADFEQAMAAILQITVNAYVQGCIDSDGVTL